MVVHFRLENVSTAGQGSITISQSAIRRVVVLQAELKIVSLTILVGVLKLDHIIIHSCSYQFQALGRGLDLVLHSMVSIGHRAAGLVQTEVSLRLGGDRSSGEEIASRSSLLRLPGRVLKVVETDNIIIHWLPLASLGIEELSGVVRRRHFESEDGLSDGGGVVCGNNELSLEFRSDRAVGESGIRRSAHSP